MAAISGPPTAERPEGGFPGRWTQLWSTRYWSAVVVRARSWDADRGGGQNPKKKKAKKNECVPVLQSQESPKPKPQESPQSKLRTQRGINFLIIEVCVAVFHMVVKAWTLLVSPSRMVLCVNIQGANQPGGIDERWFLHILIHRHLHTYIAL